MVQVFGCASPSSAPGSWEVQDCSLHISGAGCTFVYVQDTKRDCKCASSGEDFVISISRREDVTEQGGAFIGCHQKCLFTHQWLHGIFQRQSLPNAIFAQDIWHTVNLEDHTKQAQLVGW